MQMIHYDYIKTYFPEQMESVERATSMVISRPHGIKDGFNALCSAFNSLGEHASAFVPRSAMVMYNACGQQVFEIGPHMVDMLARTDLESVPIEDIKFPFPAFYVDFRGCDRFQIWGGSGTGFHTVAGIYVIADRPEDGVGVAVVAWGKENEKSLCRGDDATLWAGLSIPSGKTAEAAIVDLVTKNDGIIPNDMDPAPQIYREKQSSTLREMLRVAINLSLYLSTANAEVELIHNEHKELLKKKLKNAKNPGKKKKYATQISKMSDAVRRVVASGVERNGSRDASSAHWVRGHWHTYWTGAGRGTKSRKWVMPFIRGHGEAPQQHTYSVKDG